MRKTINVIEDRQGKYIAVLRGGRLRRYRHPSAASLARVRGLIRQKVTLRA